MNDQTKMKKILFCKTFALFLLLLLLWPCLTNAGDLEPEAAPGPTMHTLEQIYEKPVWRIQGMDFMTWPHNSRFKVSYDGYVLPGVPNWTGVVIDEETGLMWARNAQAFTPDNWFYVMFNARNTFLAGRKGWRLPAVEEILTLIDETAPVSPKLPPGHPFVNITPPGIYWTSTTYEGDNSQAYYIDTLGNVYWGSKNALPYHMWLVRGGVK